jgi:hypothetical protein
MRKFLLVTALSLAASAAQADGVLPDTIYNPNVSFPSLADVQSLRFLEPDYGLKEQLHLNQPWNLPAEDHAQPNDSVD